MAQIGEECIIMGNQERNTYVCNAMTDALLKMLKMRKLSDISIGEIAEQAGVSRNSFYRNYDSKEDILRRRIRSYLNDWKEWAESNKASDPHYVYGQLFRIVEEHRDFFLLMKDSGVLYLLQDEFFKFFGPSEEDDVISAYSKAFFAYSTFGFLETWIRRNMKETADEMEKMLTRRDTLSEESSK